MKNGASQYRTNVPARLEEVELVPVAVQKILAPIASLRVTVVLFALSIVLVFLGTLAQVDSGIWTIVDKYFRSFIVMIPFNVIDHLPGLYSADDAQNVKYDFRMKLTGEFPFPGGWLLGSLLLVNLLAAHLVRFRLSWKRSGILIIHFGLIVMLLSELVTGMLAVEANMAIKNGFTSNTVSITRRLELAVTDYSNLREEATTIVPQRFLKSESTIAHDDLPFDLEIVSYFPNSKVRERTEEDQADDPKLLFAEARMAEKVMKFAIESLPEGTGTDSNQKVDSAAMELRLLRKTAASGNAESDREIQRLVLGLHEAFSIKPIRFDGKLYAVDFRFKQKTLPFALRLEKFSHDKYLGTNKARNYSSRVRLIDKNHDEDRPIDIRMNEPLRYGGYTFYQSSFLEQDSGTILQVVDNPGWLMPYISCFLVGVGMLLHFGIMLTNFLDRRLAIQKAEGERSEGRWLAMGASALVLAFCGYLFLEPRPPSDETQPNYQKFAAIPIIHNGRIKPMDTLARTTMMSLCNRQSWKDESNPDAVVSRPAIQFLVEVLANPKLARTRKVFRIENSEVQSFMGLESRPGFLYAFDELEPKFEDLEKKFNATKEKESKDRTLFDTQLGKLAQQTKLFKDLELHREPYTIPTGKAEDWVTVHHVAVHMVNEKVKEKYGAELRELRQGDHLREDQRAAYRNQVDTWFREALGDPLVNEGHVLSKSRGAEVIGQSLILYAGMLKAYRDGEYSLFNRAAEEHIKNLDLKGEVNTYRAATELRYNRADIFWNLIALYLLTFLIACGSWIAYLIVGERWTGWAESLRATAFWTATALLAVHTIALILRMYIQQRPPVTSLYSSAIFIGWSSVLLALLLESLFRNGLGNAVGSIIGFLTLIVAHYLGTDGDTFDVLQAVLDTNFWLATHVVMISVGYTATFLAGFIGLAFILLGVFTPVLRGEVGQVLTRMVYGVTCFAIFNSFIGTVLGGIWADQSWGRFWGWDPKENGALLIVLMNSIVLHARWGGMIKQRGMAVLAVLSNVITAWSWFGTNLLGVGLHSYGFTSGTAMWLGIFVASQVLFALIGMVPLRLWWSFRVPQRPMQALNVEPV